jgi:FkbM family methyltransferase
LCSQFLKHEQFAAGRKSPGFKVMRFIQSILLALYRGTRGTGFLSTSLGRWLFEHAYWTYKALVEARGLRSLHPYVVPGATVIDVGANIGFFTVPFARWVGAKGCVISIEPETANFQSLRSRVERLRLASAVSLVNAAAVEAPGQVRLALNPDNPADHRVASEGMLVTGVSIDALVEERGWPPISFMKIDVQGGELSVIRGARETLRRFRPGLFVEFDEPSLARAGTSTTELLGELLALGYEPHAMTASGSWMPIEDGELREQMLARGYSDLLLLFRDRANGA